MENLNTSEEKTPSNYIIDLIEECLKQDKIKDKNFGKNILIQILQNFELDNFITLITEKIKNKNFIFVRHAQAQHNEYNLYHRDKGIDKPKFFDPNITQEGISQCENIKNSIKNLNFKIDVIYISPLRRTLQTFNKIKEVFTNNNGDEKNNYNNNFIVTELLREIVSNPDTHFGHHLTQMKQILDCVINYDYIIKDYWWSYEKDESYFHVDDKSLLVTEKKKHFKMRIAIFLIWAIFRQEQNSCIISHSKVYKIIFMGTKSATHGGCYVLENKDIISFLEKFIFKNLKKFKMN